VVARQPGFKHRSSTGFCTEFVNDPDAHVLPNFLEESETTERFTAGWNTFLDGSGSVTGPYWKTLKDGFGQRSEGRGIQRRSVLAAETVHSPPD